MAGEFMDRTANGVIGQKSFALPIVVRGPSSTTRVKA